MSDICINCGVLFGPMFAALVLIVAGISTDILNWDDLKQRKFIVAELGIVLLAFSSIWMIIQLFKYEKAEYIPLFGPGFISIIVTIVGVYRMRHDVNFTGADYTYSGIVLFLGGIGWIYWVLEAFS